MNVAEFGQVTLCLRARVRVAGADDYAGARLQEAARDHRPDAPGAAGDECVFSTQIEQVCVRGEVVVRHSNNVTGALDVGETLAIQVPRGPPCRRIQVSPAGKRMNRQG